MGQSPILNLQGFKLQYFESSLYENPDWHSDGSHITSLLIQKNACYKSTEISFRKIITNRKKNITDNLNNVIKNVIDTHPDFIFPYFSYDITMHPYTCITFEDNLLFHTTPTKQVGKKIKTVERENENYFTELESHHERKIEGNICEPRKLIHFGFIFDTGDFDVWENLSFSFDVNTPAFLSMKKNIPSYELHEETFYRQLECLKHTDGFMINGICALQRAGRHCRHRKRKTSTKKQKQNQNKKQYKQTRTRRARRQTSHSH